MQAQAARTHGKKNHGAIHFGAVGIGFPHRFQLGNKPVRCTGTGKIALKPHKINGCYSHEMTQKPNNFDMSCMVRS
jgi:hypothetical protein